LASLDLLHPARVGPLLSRRSVDHCDADPEGAIRDGVRLRLLWDRSNIDAVGRVRGSYPSLVRSIAVKSRDGQASPVTVAIRHDPQERTTFATRVPCNTAGFGKLFGNGFNFVLGHIRFFRYGPRKLTIRALDHVPGKRNVCQHIED
jgi:hypothetical protein